VSDGALLLSFPFAVLGPGFGVAFGPDGWVAIDDAEGKIRAERLGSGADSGAIFSATGLHVLPWTTRWLKDAKLAFIGDGGLHIAHADGSDSRVLCNAKSLVAAQAAY
jgi:hypothetical protein